MTEGNGGTGDIYVVKSTAVITEDSSDGCTKMTWGLVRVLPWRTG